MVVNPFGAMDPLTHMAKNCGPLPGPLPTLLLVQALKEKVTLVHVTNHVNNLVLHRVFTLNAIHSQKLSSITQNWSSWNQIPRDTWDCILFTRFSIRGEVLDNAHLMPSSCSRQFLCFVLMTIIVEKPYSHRYVDSNDKSKRMALSATLGVLKAT